MHSTEYIENSELITESKKLLHSTCAFVPIWKADEITPSTFRLYSKKFPVKEATRKFVNNARQYVATADTHKQKDDDVDKLRYSHGE